MGFWANLTVRKQARGEMGEGDGGAKQGARWGGGRREGTEAGKRHNEETKALLERVTNKAGFICVDQLTEVIEHNVVEIGQLLEIFDQENDLKQKRCFKIKLAEAHQTDQKEKGW